MSLPLEVAVQGHVAVERRVERENNDSPFSNEPVPSTLHVTSLIPDDGSRNLLNEFDLADPRHASHTN